jgi:hypothetical protein
MLLMENSWCPIINASRAKKLHKSSKISLFPQQAILFVSENLLNFYLSIYLKLAIQEKLFQIVLSLKSVQD